MALEKKISLWQRMDALIRRKATGPPRQFAQKLGISESSLYRYLKDLENLGAQIEYDAIKERYRYTQPGKLFIGFSKEEAKKIKGGNSHGQFTTLKKWKWHCIALNHQVSFWPRILGTSLLDSGMPEKLYE